MPPSALLRSATLLVLAVGTQGRPTLDVRPESTLSASRHEADGGMEGVRKDAALAHAVSLAREREQSTFDSSSSADTALRKAMEAGELEGLMDAIHENADTASPKVLDKARALRDTLREAKNLPETLSKSNAASSADAALHKAMESGELEALMDAIHENAEAASPEVLEDARTLRDSLREAKHAPEATASAEDPAPATTEEVAESEETPGEAEAEEVEEGEEGEEGEVAAKEDVICPRPNTWCGYVGATNEATRCDKVPGHYCTDIFGKSGFWPCDTKIKATWGVGIECIRDEEPAQAVATPVPAAWADAADVDSAAEAISDAAQQADEAEAARAEKAFEEREAKRGNATSGKKAKVSEYANIDKLSHLFFTARPTSELATAGVTIHCFDDTEVLPAEPWRPCDSGMCAQFAKWWSTSIVNWAQRTTFGDHGIVLAPDYNRILCAYPYDSGTMMSGCGAGTPGLNEFNASELGTMMTQSMFWKLGYNEVLIDSKNFTENLPASIAAFIYNLKGQDTAAYTAKAGQTYHRYFAFLTHFNLTESDVPLLKANFSSWRSRKHDHVPPETCKGGVDGWAKGECPPKLIKDGDQDGSEPLFTDMTTHAREYLRLNPREEAQPRQWLENHAFREGASREIPIEYERLKRMQPAEFEEELARRLRTQSKTLWSSSPP
jgi:hypothetical protein